MDFGPTPDVVLIEWVRTDRTVIPGRLQQRVPSVMLTARGEETDRVVGLELGADDYGARGTSWRWNGTREANGCRRLRARA